MRFWIVPSTVHPDTTCYILRDDGIEVKVTFNRTGKSIKFIGVKAWGRKYDLSPLEKLKIHEHYQITEKIVLND